MKYIYNILRRYQPLTLVKNIKCTLLPGVLFKDKHLNVITVQYIYLIQNVLVTCVMHNK